MESVPLMSCHSTLLSSPLLCEHLPSAGKLIAIFEVFQSHVTWAFPLEPLS